MKWLRNSVTIAKTLSLTLSAFTMVASPLAQGAAAAANTAPQKVIVDYSKYNWKVDKTNVSEFMKFSGLGSKRITVGQFYAKMRPMYPVSVRNQMDVWAQANKNDLMPSFEVSTYQDTEGKEQIRLQMSMNGQTANISYAPGSKDKYIKFNNTYLARTDLFFPEQIVRKLAAGDKMVAKQMVGAKPVNLLHKPLELSFEEFKRFTPVQRAEYLIRVREMVQAAEQVLRKYDRSTAFNDEPSKEEYFASWVLGIQAEAAEKVVRGAKVGDACVIAGYISVYGENYSCGGTKQGNIDLMKQVKKAGGTASCNGGIPCNPLLYHKADGSNVCVSTIRTATFGDCPGQAPLKKATDVNDLINGYLRSHGIKDAKISVADNGTNENGEKKYKINQDKLSSDEFNAITSYVNEANRFVDRAVKTCTTIPLAATVQVRDEQKQACSAIALRKLNVDFYDGAVTVVAPIPPPVPAVKNCQFELPGSIEKNGSCVCESSRVPSSMDDPERGEIAICTDPIAKAEVTQSKEDVCIRPDGGDRRPECAAVVCGTLCWMGNHSGLMWGGLAAAGVIGFIAWNQHSNTPQTLPPDPCLNPVMINSALCHPVTPVTPTVPVVQPPPPVVPVTPVTPVVPVVPVTPVTPITPVTPVVPVPIPTTTVETTSNGTGATGATGSAR